MSDDAFSTNLRQLCSFMPSVSEVSRRLAINRSQLNKYLAGTSHPRQAVMRKIADLFGVEVHEMLLPPDEFASLISARRQDAPGSLRLLCQTVGHLVRKCDERIRTIAGLYFEYYHSLSRPGYILCTLMAFRYADGVTYYRRHERVGDPGRWGLKKFRYDGVALMFGDRIFLSDYETRAEVELTQTVLYPDYRADIREMQGIKIGVSADRQRSPCAVRVFLQRVPKGTSVSEGLRKCGLYSLDSAEIPDHIRTAIDNRQSGPYHFTCTIDR